LSQVLTRLILAQDEALIPVSLEQPLLWYRLLPNPTYPLGILINLAIAVGPLLALILYLARRHWHWDWLQWLAVIGSLLGFLAAGLVASVKIGGGSNLHNLDMFLVGLLILSAQTIIKVSERTAFSEPIADSGSWQQALLILVVIVPSWWAIRSGFPLRLPSAKATEATVEQLVAEVEAASEQGTVLMMDQRQLLTFGQLDIPLAMEYELKHVFNQAMGANQAYFDQYEADLAASRYSMIVTIPVKVQYQGRSHQFGEENDAFTRWVAEPMLEHYQLQTEFVEEEIWLMVPRP
jgi:prepilin signal peptidase PulO-like enzyme (type II secretory pathway)